MIVRTGIAMILADELEADWQRVRIRQAPGDETRFDPAGKDQQNTDGSRSIRHHFEVMRELGAAGRHVIRDRGNVDEALGSAVRVVEAEYFVPYLVHTPMEPPVALADATRMPVRVVTSTQAPNETRQYVAEALGIEKTEVESVSVPSPSAINWSPLSTADDGAGGERPMGACAAGIHGCKSALIRSFGRSISSNLT